MRAPYAFALDVWEEPLGDQALAEEAVANLIAQIGKVTREEPKTTTPGVAPEVEMIMKTQELVKLGLNFPKTADFNFFTNSRLDAKNGVFIVSETVGARNGFNVPVDVAYSAKWVRVGKDDWQLSYFQMGGEVAVDKGLESDVQKRRAREAKEADERFLNWKSRRVASREATDAAAAALSEWRAWMRDSREWTSKAGSKQRAKIGGVFTIGNVQMIRLVHRDGSDMQFELSLLTEADQQLAKDWHESRRSRR